MPEAQQTNRRQFSLLLFLITVGVLLGAFYFVWLWYKTKPPHLGIMLQHGGLYRQTTVIQNMHDEQFEGGIIVLKNDGLLLSVPISIPAKEGFSIENTRDGETKLVCTQHPSGIVLLEIGTELRTSISTQSSRMHHDHVFHSNQNEWRFQSRELLIDNFLHRFQIIICDDLDAALTKYTKYDEQIHAGQAATNPVEIPQRNKN